MRTVAELQDELERLGHPRVWVGRADDPSTPRVDGMWLVTPDAGRWRAAVWERGQESHAELFDSEADAVAALASRVLRPPPTGPAMSDDERRALHQREQQKAKAELRKLRDGRGRRDG